LELDLTLENLRLDLFLPILGLHGINFRWNVNDPENVKSCLLGFPDIRTELLCISRGHCSSHHCEDGNEDGLGPLDHVGHRKILVLFGFSNELLDEVCCRVEHDGIDSVLHELRETEDEPNDVAFL